MLNNVSVDKASLSSDKSSNLLTSSVCSVMALMLVPENIGRTAYINLNYICSKGHALQTARNICNYFCLLAFSPKSSVFPSRIK
jgi:hypothetical protein